jgi:hypothetical protein
MLILEIAAGIILAGIVLGIFNVLVSENWTTPSHSYRPEPLLPVIYPTARVIAGRWTCTRCGADNTVSRVWRWVIGNKLCAKCQTPIMFS